MWHIDPLANGRQLIYGILKLIFVKEKTLYHDLDFTEGCSYDQMANISALAHVIAWCGIGDKP